MTTIGKTINSNTVRHIKKIAATMFAVFLASIAVYTLGYKLIMDGSKAERFIPGIRRKRNKAAS